jgi:uncharacterized protein
VSSTATAGPVQVDWRSEWKPLALIAAVFAAFYFLPEKSSRLDGALIEGVRLVGWYAREHVLLCLIPAFYIAGAITVFLSQRSVMKYLGPRAPKPVAYGVASVTGTILAVCSCTVLPLFGGIYRMGAGLGPAAAFLYSGPAINVLAIVLTARVLGLEMGIARAAGAVVFAAAIGLAMQFVFRREETERTGTWGFDAPEETPRRSLATNVVFFGLLIAILVFANWGRPENGAGLWMFVWSVRWWLVGAAALGLGLMLIRSFGIRAWKVALVALPVAALAVLREPIGAFAAGAVGISILLAADRGEAGEWFSASWAFAKQIAPLLFAGVFVAGFLLGRPGHEGLIPSSWVASAVGGNSISAVLLASVAGALMYFATLTEVPILQGLIGSGMGSGPALALLLAGPSLSLPSMLVIAGMIGWRKTLTYVALVVTSATVAGVVYGFIT